MAFPAKTVLCNVSRLSGQREGYSHNMSLFPSANDFKSGPGVEKDAPARPA